MSAKVLIVEDEFTIALDLETRLTAMKYEVVACAQNYEEALVCIIEHDPDIVLMDININGNVDGIETAKQIFAKFKTPVIFVTALNDDATFKRALEAVPYGYVTKPFKDTDLKNNIEIALQKERNSFFSEVASNAENFDPEEHLKKDFIFIKNKNQFDKIHFNEIIYLEAMDNYTKIHTADKKYTISYYLRDFYAQLPQDLFIRTHRSFVVAFSAIQHVDANSIGLSGQISIPIGKSFKKEFFDMLKLYS